MNDTHRARTLNSKFKGYDVVLLRNGFIKESSVKWYYKDIKIKIYFSPGVIEIWLKSTYQSAEFTNLTDFEKYLSVLKVTEL